MTARYTVTLLQEAVADLRRLEDFAIEREFASETPDWTTPEPAFGTGYIVLFEIVDNEVVVGAVRHSTTARSCH